MSIFYNKKESEIELNNTRNYWIDRFFKLSLCISKTPLDVNAVLKYKNLIIKDIEEGISKTKGKYEIVVDRKEAIKKAINMMTKKDIVILAGKGHETYQEINGKKYPFDEREIVKEILGEKK